MKYRDSQIQRRACHTNVNKTSFAVITTGQAAGVTKTGSSGRCSTNCSNRLLWYL